MPIGIVMELFWLDLLRLGAVIPPSGTLSFLLLFLLSLSFQWETPSQLVLPMLFCLPFAHTIIWLEKWQRRKNDAIFTGVYAWVEQNNAPPLLSAHATLHKKTHAICTPKDAIARALWRSIWSYGLLFFACYTLLYGFFLFLQTIQALPLMPPISWNMFYGMGLMGAILALRTKRAYAILAIGALILLLRHI